MEEEYGPKVMPSVHPGAILDHDFLTPMNMAPAYLAEAIGVDVALIQGIIKGRIPSLLRRLCCSRVSLAPPRSYGWVCKTSMIWMWQKTAWLAGWTRW